MNVATITGKAVVKDDDGNVLETIEKVWPNLSVMKTSQCRSWCTRTSNTLAKRSSGVRLIKASFSGFSHDNGCHYGGGVRLLVENGHIRMRHLEGSME